MNDKLKGNWKHIKKSQEWENYNENFAKGKIGTFSDTTGKYLKWESNDGKVTMFIEVARLTFHNNDESVLIHHRSGLTYWFKRPGEKDGTEKKKKAIKRRLPSEGNGSRNQESYG